MKTRVVVLLAILILEVLALHGCSVLAPDFSAPRAEVKMIYADSGNGSGVVIAPNILLTAGHVANHEAEGLKVEGKVAKTLRVGDSADLGLMAAEGVTCPCAKLADYPPAQDEPLIIVGYPFNSYVKVQVVTSGRAQGASDGYLVMAADAAPGNSGGGVFVYRGGEWQLAGILVRGMQSEGGYLTFAVDVDSIRKFLAA